MGVKKLLTPDELEAAVLGAQWVAYRGDAVLARAARCPLTGWTSPIWPTIIGYAETVRLLAERGIRLP
jgi:hypothetical protein